MMHWNEYTRWSLGAFGVATRTVPDQGRDDFELTWQSPEAEPEAPLALGLSPGNTSLA